MKTSTNYSITNYFSQLNDFKQSLSLNNNKISGLYGTALSLFLSSYFLTKNQSIVLILPSQREVEVVYENLSTFLKSYSNNIGFYLHNNSPPYIFSKLPKQVIHHRLHAKYLLSSKEKSIVITSIRAVNEKILTKDIFLKSFITIQVGNEISLNTFRKKLEDLNYLVKDKVSNIGEYAIRGDIIDVFSPHLSNPVRIFLFEKEIEEIKLFNVKTQKSYGMIKETNIITIDDTFYGNETLEKLVKIIEKDHKNKANFQQIQAHLSTYNQAFCFKELLPLLEQPLSSIIDYSNDQALKIITFNEVSLKKSLEHLVKDYTLSYEQKSNQDLIVTLPSEVFFSYEEMIESSRNNNCEMLAISPFKADISEEMLHFSIKSIEHFKNDLHKALEHFKSILAKKHNVVIFAAHQLRAEKLQELFAELQPILIKNIEAIEGKFFSQEMGSFFINVNSISNGIYFGEWYLICDHEIFGKKRKRINAFESSKTEVIEHFIDLKEEDFVVHVNHGIGIYKGIERIKLGRKEKDYLKVEYAKESNLFVPIEQMNFLQKYIGKSGGKVKIDQLGGKSWDKVKNRVKSNVEELAEKLISLYSSRKKYESVPFSEDDYYQHEFEAAFLFEETKDQLKVCEEVKKDMEKSTPMDRLLCADVGFGKTEVAMRAAFKAVMNHRQVAFIVPTTILSIQHYQNFLKRFKDFPTEIEVLNRFKSFKEQKRILANLENGKTEILIGTHKLFSKKVVFKRLGLLVIDEEQKFGVKQKELLKEKYPYVHTLSLSATPIPRTLHMSLISVRSISTMNTPPVKRQAVNTFVTEFDEEIIKRAVEKEIARKGQVYFVHNRVETISNMYQYLAKILPKVSIKVAHGKMEEKQLEDVIDGFIEGEYEILLSTAIIDSGLDIPRANTIFVNNADHFGLSQLYQIKGRVGRSDRSSYAYFFYSKNKLISEEAFKRLNSISEYTELGSGFKIAMKDLEIRGAGNVLGPEQSGNVMAVGFDLYCKLLNEAVENLSIDIKKEHFNGTLIDLKYHAFIPDNYVKETKEKVAIYKRISAINRIEQILETRVDLEDRYGKLPKIIEKFFILCHLRIRASQLHILSIIEKPQRIEIIFAQTSSINYEDLIELAKEKYLFLSKDQHNLISIQVNNNENEPLNETPFEEKIEYLNKVVNDLIK